MLYKACDTAALAEGAHLVATIERKRYLVLWPKGDRPRAFRALCPHQEASLAEAPFDGTLLTCPHHGWTFDGTTGACVSGQVCAPIKELPLTIVGEVMLIDVPAKKPRPAVEA